MPFIQLLPDIFVPTFEMTVNGSPLKPLIAKTILSISVTEHLSPPSEFQFELNDPMLEFIDKQEGLFKEGSRVEISLGFIGNTRKMMVGKISALTAHFPNSGPATVTVAGFDLMHAMTRGTIYRKFGVDKGIPDSKIVEQIAQEAKLTPSVDPTPARDAPRVQKCMTNFAFLEMLAELNHYFLWIEGDTLNFKREQPARDPIKLEWRKTLMSFSPRLSTAGQVNSVQVRGWDPIQKEPISARVQRSGAAMQELASEGQDQIAQGTGGKSERVIEDVKVTNVGDAQALAEKILFEQSRALITGNGSSAGPPNIRPGTILELSGIKRFDGEYVVEQVTHSISDSGYQTSFEVKKTL